MNASRFTIRVTKAHRPELCRVYESVSDVHRAMVHSAAAVAQANAMEDPPLVVQQPGYQALLQHAHKVYKSGVRSFTWLGWELELIES